MKQLFLGFLLLVGLCKSVVAQKQSPLVSAKLITVAKDGSGDFKTIQEAVNIVRDLSQQQVTIFIKKGIYKEKLIIPSWKTNIFLRGEDAKNTIITGNDYSGKTYPNGNDAYGNDKFSTYTSFTVLVQGDDFKAENLTIENTAGRVGQAVALHIEADRCVVVNCNLLGNQDTLYTATSSSRQYFKDCFITGTTDFIFGEATAVFQDCEIKSLTNSYVTAAATSPNQEYGYVFFNCKLTAADGVNKAFLGRPWRPNAKTVFIKCDLGKHISPEGWNAWPGDAMFPNKEKTTYYAEFENTGEGFDFSKRLAWTRQLKKSEAKKYTLENIFKGWNPL